MPQRPQRDPIPLPQRELPICEGRGLPVGIHRLDEPWRGLVAPRTESAVAGDGPTLRSPFVPDTPSIAAVSSSSAKAASLSSPVSGLPCSPFAGSLHESPALHRLCDNGERPRIGIVGTTPMFHERAAYSRRVVPVDHHGIEPRSPQL